MPARKCRLRSESTSSVDLLIKISDAGSRLAILWHCMVGIMCHYIELREIARHVMVARYWRMYGMAWYGTAMVRFQASNRSSSV